jgi:uncharacterized phiE125 gp8 family phage protein
MSLQLVTPAAVEPITLAEAKTHLRVDFADDDALITTLIAAARQQAEAITKRQICTATWKLALDAFPGPSLIGVPAGDPFTLPGHAILVPKAPVASIASIQYLDMASTLQTMSSTLYTTDLACEPARITPVFGQIWPIALPQIGAVTVTFVAGYGPATAVPEGLKAWIKIRIGSMYANREEVTSARSTPVGFVDSLLDPYKVQTL